MSVRVVKGVRRGTAFVISLDGAPVTAFPGETVATVLLAAGVRAFGRTAAGAARGPYCNMGVCHECLVDISARPDETPLRLRACMISAEPGMVVRRPDDNAI